ncbi:MAG: N-acetyl-gamma-glutamyl-phosphate reductase [Actinomycetaceae bacterium]|nr:N-acetyl-gamma-glutamyl-phosphate reductase [Actinomycetaceae bacterium]
MVIRVGIVGASGFAGSEIARILLTHSQAQIETLMAHRSAGERFGSLHAHIPQLADRLIESTDVDHLQTCDVVFVALPHGQSALLTQELEGGPLVIDCGADHRLTSESAWDRFYGGIYPGAWAYGMPELVHAQEYEDLASGNLKKAKVSREILSEARSVAVPGCNVSAVTLALQPAVAAGLIDSTRITATLAVGYSGAGRSAKTHLMATAALSNMAPYSALGKHRHIPEIVQNLEVAGGQGVSLDFTPILTPTSRGILAVVNAPLAYKDEGVSEKLSHAYRSCYDHESLVTVVDDLPQTQPILGTGRATVWAGINEEAGTVTAISAIDNLGKGTASTAVQSMNLALGLDETDGIPMIGVAP